ncbi:MAG: hypothetical protein KBT82_11780 [Marinobacter sp.]|uniref:hypothetical protein n=1 Tax=Marinobacter sp. TaxID=50741 RepID=UPI001B530166|nr:hypothetical protein [Marinobacter sp.]MBQ0746345.1 hypothetical protein [Marinobacter sp.]MBQ0814831.1 hypothetical protein [Marinobacter sp.]|tara:strand:+ start:2509 stop:3516 length:1008 start_codon:yes stop_codon:yes gene_type:complete
MLKINRENLKSSHQLIWFIIDFLMLGLLIINLAFIIWDSAYNFIAIQNLLKENLPAFQAAYHPIHENFILYDAMFVAVFLSEFFVRWGYAIRAKVYDRWYFYPFIHWYDLVGSIPVGSLRFLRILRVISIVYRLHQYKIIDVTDTGIFRFVNFYYEAFMEELSDRIVAKVLSGVQHEIKLGSPLFEKIQNDILYPRREMLSEWISQRVAQAAKEGYVPNRGALRSYLEDRVDHALKQNVELSRLKYLPVVGSTIQETLEDAVGDIVANVIQQILEDLASSSNHAFIEDIVNAFIRGPGEPDTDEGRNEALIALIIEVIDAIKGQVRVKRWREQLP